MAFTHGFEPALFGLGDALSRGNVAHCDESYKISVSRGRDRRRVGIAP